jgi:hypothetical protein
MKKLLVSLISAGIMAAGIVYLVPSMPSLMESKTSSVQVEEVGYEWPVRKSVKKSVRYKTGSIIKERMLTPCEKSKQWLGNSIDDYIKETAPTLIDSKTKCLRLWKLAEEEKNIEWYGGICNDGGKIRKALYEEVSKYSKSCKERSLSDLIPRVNVSRYTTFLLKYLNNRRKEVGNFSEVEGEIDLTMHVLKRADRLEREEIIEERCGSELHIFTTPYHIEKMDGNLVEVKHYDGRILCREILKNYPSEFSLAVDFEDSKNITPLLEMSDFSFFVKHGLDQCSPILLVGDRNYFAKEVADIICEHANKTGFDKMALLDLYLANVYDQIGVELDADLELRLQYELIDCEV